MTRSSFRRRIASQRARARSGPTHTLLSRFPLGSIGEMGGKAVTRSNRLNDAIRPEAGEAASSHRQRRMASGRALSARRPHRHQHGAIRRECRAFYNKRGTCEQWIREGKGAIKWTRLSCRSFAANAVRLQLHALAYNLGNFLRTLATPEPIKDWSLTTLKEKLIKIGAKIVSHGRYVAFQMAEVAIPRQMFQEILWLIAELRPKPPPSLA